MGISKENEIELKVGLFVTIGLGLVMVAILMLGGAESVFTRTHRYVVHVPEAEGLIPGAKILLGGLHAGTVAEVDFDRAQKAVRVELAIERKHADLIREDSRAEIATQGLLGDRYVAITLGTSESPAISPGGMIPNQAASDIAQLLGRGDQLMSSLNRIAENLDQILSSFTSDDRSERFFSDLADLARSLNSQMTEMQLGELGKRLNSILEKIDRGQGTVGALINDPAVYDDLKSLTGGANRNRMVRNLVRKTIRDNEEAGAQEEAGTRP